MSIEARQSLIAFKSIRRISGASVVYSDGSNEGTLTAVPADTIVETTDEQGQTVRSKIRDYLILRSDLEAIIGVGEEPQRGHTIDQVVANYTRTFDVMELGGEVIRWWDKSMQVFRIHTVEVEKVTTTTETTEGS